MFPEVLAGGTSFPTVAEPELEIRSQQQQQPEWRVIVFDNDFNTWAEVEQILQQATGCDLEEARMETWEVHFLGRSVVHYAGEAEAERVAAVIRTIGIQVSVEPW